MQSVSRRGLAQVRLALLMTHPCALQPIALTQLKVGVSLLQAGGRLLRTSAVNDASFASLATADKV